VILVKFLAEISGVFKHPLVTAFVRRNKKYVKQKKMGVRNKKKGTQLLQRDRAAPV